MRTTFTLTIGTRTWRVPMEHWHAVYDQVTQTWRDGHGTIWFPSQGKDTYTFLDRTTPVTLHG